MRLCFVTYGYPTIGKVAGVGSYTYTIAHAMAARGHDVHVLVTTREKSSEASDGSVHLHLCWTRWLPVVERWMPGLGTSLCVYWALRRLHRKLRFDAIECPTEEALAFVSALFRGLPLVVRVHLAPSERQHKMKSPVADRFTDWIEWMTIRLAKIVATPSDSESGIVAKHCRRQDVFTVHHGIVIPDHPSPERSLSVLYVGHISDPRKDVRTLLKAVPSVLKEVNAVRFDFVGPDPQSVCERQFREENPGIGADRVVFHGRLALREVYEFMSECAAYASASIAESFGLAVVEAMSHGKPVVVCGASAMLEIVEDGVTGILVPPHDASAFAHAINQLLKDEKRRLQMGEAARRSVLDKFTDAKMAENFEKFIETALNIRHSVPDAEQRQ